LTKQNEKVPKIMTSREVVAGGWQIDHHKGGNYHLKHPEKSGRATDLLVWGSSGKIKRVDSPEEIEKARQKKIFEFIARRARFLLYK
jgi:hypothetical protein